MEHGAKLTSPTKMSASKVDFANTRLASRRQLQRPLAAAFLALAASCAIDPLDRAFGPSGRTIREAIGTFPPEQQRAFEVVQRRCTKCHTLNKPFAAHVEAGTWRSIVRRMSREPGAGIPPEEHEVIAGFLEYFHGTLRAGEEKR